MRIYPKDYAAFHRLSGSADGQHLLAYLDGEFHDTVEALLAAKDEDVAKLRGKAQFIRNLLVAFRDSERLRKPTS